MDFFSLNIYDGILLGAVVLVLTQNGPVSDLGLLVSAFESIFKCFSERSVVLNKTL